ncbi:MAG: glutathione transferase GstA [Pseudomonadota bacterium]
MKLYFSKGACSLAVRIVINEIGIDCEYEKVNLKTKVTASEHDFLKINSKGSVPALELDNKEVLTENSVIQQYLADNYQATTLLPPVPDFKRYRVLEWLNYVSTEIHKGFSPLFNDKIPDAVKQEIFIPNLQKKFSFLNEHLENKKFIMGENFSLPDAYLFVMLVWAEKMKIALTDKKALSRYYEELQQRESIKKSLREEE